MFSTKIVPITKLRKICTKWARVVYMQWKRSWFRKGTFTYMSNANIKALNPCLSSWTNREIHAHWAWFLRFVHELRGGVLPQEMLILRHYTPVTFASYYGAIIFHLYLTKKYSIYFNQLFRLASSAGLLHYIIKVFGKIWRWVKVKGHLPPTSKPVSYMIDNGSINNR